MMSFLHERDSRDWLALENSDLAIPPNRTLHLELVVINSIPSPTDQPGHAAETTTRHVELLK